MHHELEARNLCERSPGICCHLVTDGVRIACDCERSWFFRFSDSFHYRPWCLPDPVILRLRAPAEDAMKNNQILDVPQVGSQAVVAEEKSVLLRQNNELQEDNADLRASALWWKTLYEEAQRRYADLEVMARANDGVEVRFPLRASTPARPSRVGAPRRAL